VKISCPTCSAKYSVADEKIQSRLAKIRCRKCSSTIVIDGTTSPAKVYVGDASAAISPSSPPQDTEGSPGSGRGGFSAPAPGLSDPVGPAPDEYAVDIADNDQRNMTIHQIVGAYNEGLITADTYIWKEGMADWQTLGEVREVASALHAAARPAATAQPAAVRRGNHNSSADLFGRIHTAGGEDDITTSAPEAAPAMTAGTGARNESSVLFSLSALTGSPAAAAPPMGGSSSKRRGADDSGLIDLQALTSADTSGAGGFAAAPGAFGASPLISAPLGGVSGPALGGGPGYGGRSGTRWGLIAAGVVLAVAMLGGAVMFLPHGGGEADPPTSALASAPERPAAPKEPAPKEPEANAPSEPGQPNTAVGTTRPVAADELPTVPSEPAAAAKPPSAAKPRTPRPAVAKPTSVLPPAPTPVAEAAPKPAAAAPAAEPKKRCECKASDLLCAMKCSAKKP
jgi:predicted Zn finger-like uncharacterized protein